MIIQTIGLDPSRALWTDDPPNVSRPVPSDARQLRRRGRPNLTSVPDIDIAVADVGQDLGHPVGDLGRVAQHLDDADLALVPGDAVVADLRGRDSVGIEDVF
jgi:hypothetical protein